MNTVHDSHPMLNPVSLAGQQCWLSVGGATPADDNAAQALAQGRFTDLASACVPVLDRGFIFGDGLYEVVPVYGRVPFRWPEHRARLVRSLSKLRIADPLDDAGWTTLVRELVARHPWEDQFVYLQVTRGVARRDHAFPPGSIPGADGTMSVLPTVFAMTSPLSLPAPELLASGVALASIDDERWLKCDIKSTSLLGNVLAKQAAIEAGVYEVAMFRDGCLTEGSASNLWIVREGVVVAPPRDHRVLEGIRYGLVEALCAEAGLRLELRPVPREEVLAADEMMMSSATKELLPVTTLDGRPVGRGADAGRPGPVWRTLYDGYQRAKARAIAAG